MTHYTIRKNKLSEDAVNRIEKEINKTDFIREAIEHYIKYGEKIEKILKLLESGEIQLASNQKPDNEKTDEEKEAEEVLTESLNLFG